VKVGLLGFYRISLAIGGVDLCLNADQNASTDRDDFGSGYSGIDLHQGVNKAVQGKQALAFVRQRHGLPHGDLDRIHRQQYFLAAAFRKISSKGTLLDFGRQQALINAVGKSLSKDSSLNLLSFAGQMQDLSAGKLQFATIPVSGTPTIQFNGSPLSIVSLDWAEIPGFVERMTGVKVSPTESEAPDSVVGAVELARPAANPSAATSAVSSPQPSTDDETFNAGTASCID
jgi:anionic cell wall polymer biosynthesis LytR-Cps2A-Psr (LCP) family protein